MYTISSPFKIMFSKEATSLLGKKLWVVTNSVNVKIHRGADIYELTIPKGFLTDGASIPKVFQWLFHKVDETINAAIIHDYLCEHHVVKLNGKEIKLPRRQIDKIFYEILKEDKVKSTKALMLYQACRLYSTATRKQLNEKPELKKSLEAKLAAEDYCFD